MKLSLKFIAVLLLAISAFASAQTLTGTVTNGTTGKPAAGDEVVLLSLGQGMEEAGRTTADAKGKFQPETRRRHRSSPGPSHSPGCDLPPHGASRNDLG